MAYGMLDTKAELWSAREAITHAVSVRLDAFLTAVSLHYDTSAPTVTRWAEDAYARLQQTPERLSVWEVRRLMALWTDDNSWMQPNHAANHAYKTLAELGMDTTGMLDF